MADGYPANQIVFQVGSSWYLIVCGGGMWWSVSCGCHGACHGACCGVWGVCGGGVGGACVWCVVSACGLWSFQGVNNLEKFDEQPGKVR
eukprot:1475048-Rhodomonas_salina.1